MGFFPVDDEDDRVLQGHRPHAGRDRGAAGLLQGAGACSACRCAGQIDYSRVVTLDLGTVAPSLSGPSRPQDRIEIGRVKEQFTVAVQQAADGERLQPAGRAPADAASRARRRPRAHRRMPTIRCRSTPSVPPGAPRLVEEMDANKPTLAAAQSAEPPQPPAAPDMTIGNGDVLIAAITSCTNTSNPSVMIAAGLLAKKAVEAGLKVQPHIKTSLAPGSRIVTEYLTRAGLLPYLDKLGFSLAAYGCTTCIGNSGDLDARDQRRDHEERPGLRRGALGQPQLRGAHPPEPEGELPRQPAARRRLRDRRHRAEGPDDRAGRQGHRRPRRLPRRHLADQRRDPRR